jgi:integrase
LSRTDLLLEGVDHGRQGLHPRFQRFVRFALGTGCRLDEIRGIDSTSDIDWIRGTVHVIGKFRKERDVPMQPDARAALEEQLQEDGKLWKQNPQRLREVLAEGSPAEIQANPRVQEVYLKT